MGRRKITELKITNRDNRVFQHIAKCGVITKDAASGYVNSKRLDRLVREGFLERTNIVKNQKEFYFYKLTLKGIKYVQRNIPTVGKLYKGAGLKHDLELSKQFSLLSKQEQDLAMTENDQITMFKSSSYCSPVDLYIPSTVVVEEDEIIQVAEQVIEIITNNYKDVDIEAKINYVEQHIKTSKEIITFTRAK